MRIRRGPLFWGLLLIPLGAIPLLVRAGTLDATRFGDVGRFWPLILVGFGIAVLLGRGRGSVIGTAIVALTIGTLGGAALATGTMTFGSITDCAASPAQLSTDSEGGAFDGPASIAIDLDCGSVDLATSDAGDTGWTLEARYRNDPPVVTASGDRLEVRAPDGPGSQRQEWRLVVPAEDLGSLTLIANAGAATLDLGGASIDRLEAAVNAGDLRIDASSAGIARMDVSMNAGRARIALPSGAMDGSLSVNAGALELCVPADVGLRLRVDEQLTFGHNLDDRGLTQDGDDWSRDGTTGAVIELEIEGNAASLTLDPEGGC